MAANELPVNINHINTFEHNIYIGDHEDKPDRNESSRRTREIEDFTNLYFIHPISARLTPFLARMRVCPNSVSLTGMICGLFAGWAYFNVEDIPHAFTGFLLMLAWHILDGVDGQLARLTNSQTEFGKIIDGIADNVTFASVYVGIGLATSQTHGAWVWPLIALAGAAHSMQAAAYELQRQEFDFWGWDRKSAEYKSIETPGAENQAHSMVHRLIYAMGQSYVRIQGIVARVDQPYRDRIVSTLAVQPNHAQLIRRRYRETFSSLVHTWSIMSSNYRTILIFLCVALDVPLLYFLIELLGLTPLTLLMIRWQKIKSREFSRFLDRQTF